MRTGALAATSVLLCVTIAQAADLQRWDGTMVITPPIIAEVVPTPPPQPGSTAKSIVSAEQRLAELVNLARLSHASLDGAQLAPLKRAELLDQVAETHAARMATAGFVSHCDPTTSELPADRLAAAGYFAELAGESLVVGYGEPEEVLDALLEHPASLALVLSPQLREIGIGLAPDPNDLGNVALDLDQDCSSDLTGNGPYFHYWTILFGLREEVFPVVIEREAAETTTGTVDLYLYGEGWATEMRLENEDGAWTGWFPFAEQQTWGLSGGAGIKQVTVRVRNALYVEREASDTIRSTVGLDIVFEDGFEDGTIDAWTPTTIDGAVMERERHHDR